MFRPLVLSAALVACPAIAENDPVDLTGRWGPSESDAQFRAVLSADAGFLRLRFFPVAPEGNEDEALLDNPAIALGSTEPDARAWLDLSETGGIFVNTVTVNDGYTYSERLTLDRVEGQISVIRAEMFNVYPIDGKPVADPFDCSEGCYSCKADLLAGTVLVGEEATTLAPPPTKALDAAVWTADSIYALGFCPAPD